MFPQGGGGSLSLLHLHAKLPPGPKQHYEWGLQLYSPVCKCVQRRGGSWDRLTAAQRRTMSKVIRGIKVPPTKDTPRRSVSLESCTAAARAYPKATKRPRCDIEEQPIMKMLARSKIWATCTSMVKAWPKLTRRVLSGIASQPTKEKPTRSATWGTCMTRVAASHIFQGVLSKGSRPREYQRAVLPGLHARKRPRPCPEPQGRFSVVLQVSRPKKSQGAV